MSKFTLPDNWHIIVTEENAKDTFEWRMGEKYLPEDDSKAKKWKNQIGDLLTGVCVLGDKDHNSKKFIKTSNYDFGIEITYDQFKEHVLNQKVIKEDTNYLINILKQNNII